ncbi:aromatic amino acid DMT transporter YddG [Acinetobacter baumannii]
MKKLFLGMGVAAISISTYALDLQSHEVPAYLIQQQGYSGQVNCTYRGVLKSGVQRTFKVELCLALSIGYSNTNRQAIEVGMVNYLWPALTMVAAILFNNQKSNWLVIPGFVIAILGICWVLGGEQGLDLASMLENIKDNPLSYGLAFIGALIWATYCTVTARIANGKNGVTLFFMLTALVLWVKYLFIGGAPMVFNFHAVIYLVLAAAAMGFGYAAWNVGILHGNVTILAGASYFIPVFSAALAAIVLQTPLSMSFWQGAAMVCIGSVLCWLATRQKH